MSDELSPYFGEPWPSGICDYGIQVPTPVGVPCHLCDLLIEEDDRGSFIYALSTTAPPARLPVHRECSLRSVVGGIGHLMNHPLWCTCRHDPDAEMSYRESALAVWEYVRVHGVP